MAEKVNIREIALDILMEIEKNKKLSHLILAEALIKYQYLSKKDRSFLTRLVEGTLEYKIRLDYIVNQSAKIKIEKCKPLIRCLLQMGAYQIHFMDSVPDSAACNEAVKLAKKRKFYNLSGFVNAVLRNVSRKKENVSYPPKDSLEYASIYYSMPKWIIELWEETYGMEKNRKMLAASLEEKDTAIRINQSKVEKETLKKSLCDQKIQVKDGYYINDALLISGYDYLNKIPEFQKGYFSIQDESSMLPVLAAGIKENDIVYDVCSAPGGKTMHIADLLNGTGKVIAGDISERKAEMVRENCEHAGFKNVTVQVKDATKLDETMVKQADVVICDVPCSGMGIVGRKNDIKYRITEESIQELLEIQRVILETSAQYVKSGGVLVYSTCTVNPEENIKMVSRFLENHPFYLEAPKQHIFKDTVSVETEFPTYEKGYVQTLQGVHNCDGFFFARLRRKDD